MLMDKFKGKIIEGRFAPENPLMWDQHIQKFEGKEIVRSDKKFFQRRDKSIPQLGYYFGYVLPKLMEHFNGHTKDEMHIAVKQYILIVKRGVTQELPFPPSIESFSTIEFEDFMRDIRKHFSADHGIFISLPNQVGYDFEL